MEYILEQRNLSTLQFLCLLAIHGQRSPYGAGSWPQVRYTLTLCMELGLHRKAHRPAPSEEAFRAMELRRRVFWTAYCLDRMVSITLGRPFAISDRDIDVEMPCPDTRFMDLTDAETHISSVWSNILPFLHIIKLRRIQSRIQRLLYRADKDIWSQNDEQKKTLDTKLDAILIDLDVWVGHIPKAPANSERSAWMYDPDASHHDSQEYFHLQYHKTLLGIFTALLPTLPKGDVRLASGLGSAAAVCKAYKRLNQQNILSYTVTALHGCFLAGLTLVYCLLKDASLFSFETIEATQACTQTLTIFAEKWKGATKYRDTFDVLSEALLKRIVTPLSPIDTHSGPYKDAHCPLPAMPATSARDVLQDARYEAPGGLQAIRMLDEILGETPVSTRDVQAAPEMDNATDGHGRSDGNGFCENHCNNREMGYGEFGTFNWLASS